MFGLDDMKEVARVLRDLMMPEAHGYFSLLRSTICPLAKSSCFEPKEEQVSTRRCSSEGASKKVESESAEL